MTAVRHIAAIVALLSIAALCLFLCWGVVETVRVVKSVPAVLDNRVAADASGLRATLDTAIAEARKDAVEESRVWRRESLASASLAAHQADLRLEEGIKRVDSQLSDLNASIRTLAGIRHDLAPLLSESTAAVKAAGAVATDAQESWDDLYWDLKSTVESNTVASSELAQTLASLRSHIEPTAQALQGIAANKNRLSEDVVRLTHESLWQRIKHFFNGTP